MYSELLQQPEWSARRNIILSRDGHRCRNCGSENNLQVHHRQYHRDRKTGAFVKPWEYRDSYLVSLCLDCHQAGHKYYKIPVFNV